MTQTLLDQVFESMFDGVYDTNVVALQLSCGSHALKEWTGCGFPQSDGFGGKNAMPFSVGENPRIQWTA